MAWREGAGPQPTVSAVRRPGGTVQCVNTPPKPRPRPVRSFVLAVLAGLVANLLWLPVQPLLVDLSQHVVARTVVRADGPLGSA